MNKISFYESYGYFKTFFLYSFLIGFFIWPNFCFGADKDVVINEIAWMGTISSANDEWIELYNNTEQDIDLTNWTLMSTDGTPSILLGKNKIIPARGYFLLERTSDQTLPEISADQIYTGALGNAGENLELKNSAGQTVDTVPCTSGWFAGDNTTKQTMERKNPLADGSSSTNWANSQNPGGTPKAQNSVFEAAPQIPSEEIPPITPIGPTLTNQPPKANAGQDIIALVDQEISFDGSGSSDPENDPLSYFWNFGDGITSKEIKPKHTYFYPSTYIVTLTVNDGKNSNTAIIKVSIYSQAIIISEFIPNPKEKDEENEWIEIHNQKEQMADLSGWQIKDESSQKAFVFPDSSLIGPKQYLVIKRLVSKISLNNDKDTLFLLYPTGDICQEIKYEKAKEGYSVNFASENSYVWSSALTPGIPNIITTSKQKTSESKSLEKISQVTEPEKELSFSHPLSGLFFLVAPLEMKPTNFLNLLPQPVVAQVTEPTDKQISEVFPKEKDKNQKTSAQPQIPFLTASAGNLINRGYSDLVLVIAIIIFSGLFGTWLAYFRRAKNSSSI